MKTRRFLFILFLFVLFISKLSQAADVPSDLIIYGEDSVTLESEACVSGGSVVSGGDLTLGETSGIMGDAYVWETLSMADGSYITGDANVGLTATLDGTAVIEGTLTESVTDLPEVSIPTTTITTGSTRVKVKAGEMKILTVGNYSSVNVGPTGILILRGGSYNIKELILSKGSQVKVKGASQVVVGTTLNWGAKKSISDISREVGELTVILAGKSKSTISGYFKGVMYVPNGSVEVKNGGEVVGIVEAKSVTVDTGGLIRSASGSTECSDTEAGGDDSDAADAGADDSGDASDDSGDVDAGVADVGADDSGDSDAGAADAGVDDSGDVAAGDAGADAGAADSSTDSGDVDAGAADAGAADAGTDDSGDVAGAVDAGVDDSGTGDTGTSDGSDDGLPSDPAEVAPELDTTVTTTTYTATEFIYTGDDPIQTGVSEGTIEPTRVAVIRGKVSERDGDVLSGVTISILDHDEFGSTLTRSDGMFDMVVNGGSYLTVVYKKDGYLPVQRTVNTPWQDYVWAEDVAMVAYDSEVTTIDLSGGTTTVQTASGSESNDDDGTRTATVLFPTGTTATMTLEDGTEESLTTLNVRATEYTVGEDGFDAMPAALPFNSAYTYAVELSVDEAVTAEATEVTFNQPIYFYVENFLDFPVGETVPAGYYDREKGAWVPSDSGVIIEILGDTDGDGTTEIDSDGDGLADDATTLADLGFTDEERQTLTTSYTSGQTLWRVPMDHLTPWDCNWPSQPPDDAEVSTQNPDDDQDKQEDAPSCQNGSIIECQNQTLGETIPVTGTPFTLNYRSDRVPGRKASSILNIQVTGDSIPSSLQSVELEVTVAGQTFETELPAAANQSYEFDWDGLDAYGRKVYGAQEVTVRIGYVYLGVYISTSKFADSGSGVEISRSSTRREVVLWQSYKTTVGVPNQKGIGFGGWSLSPHHQYDVGGKTIYFGSGEKRSSSTSLTSIIDTVAGTGVSGYSGDKGDATSAQFSNIYGVGADSEGNIYIADTYNYVIRKVDSEGTVTTIAGTGKFGYTGDGGLATSAKLSLPVGGLAVDKKGNLFFADDGNQTVRKVDTDGIITTVAGTGSSGYSGDGGLATSAKLSSPHGVAVDSEGNLYISDSGNNVIRKVGTDGIISTIAGTGGSSGYSGDGGVATSAKLYNNADIALDGEGNLYIADNFNHVIRKVDKFGIISTVAGTGKSGSSGDGGSATSAKLYYPQGVALDSKGNLYISDTYNSVIRKVDTDGIITTVAGTGSLDYSGDRGLAASAELDFPVSMAVDSEGNIVFSDYKNYAIRKISQMYTGFSNEDIVISSEDGTELYKFNSVGQHESTVHAMTGTTLYTFGYDANDLLETITYEDGNVTTINHDAYGNLTSIVGPYGQTTTFTVDGNGYLKTITNPASESYTMTYDDNGLLGIFTNPRGYSSTFEFNDLGYLETDTDAASHAQTLSRSDTDDGYQVTHTSPEGATTIYKVETDSTDEKTRTNTLPDGTQSTTVFGTDGSVVITNPDGTVSTVEVGPDPRFGMEAPITESLSIKTPKGLTYSSSMEREVSLTDDDDLLSLETQTDTVTINSKTYKSVYDASSYTQTTTSPKSRSVISTFDSKGKLTESQVGTKLEPTSYTYDSNGHLSTVTLGTTDPRTTTFTYYTSDDSSKGLLESITDSLLQTVTFDYDDVGRLTTQTNPDGSIVAYTYDADGNLTSITPPSKPEHTFTYNNLDLGASYVGPDIGLSSHTIEYSYNKDKQLDSVTRPDGKIIDPEYDSSGKLTTLNADGDTYTYNYSSSTGLLTSIDDPSGGSLTFTYDGSLLLSSTLTGDVTGSIAFTYNNDFWVTKETINSTTSISFNYDDDGLMTTAGSESLTRDTDNGLITNTTLSSLTSSMTYTGIGEIKTDSYAYGATSLYSATYTRDDLGRITDKEETVDGTTTTTSYTYDGGGRLETATDGSTSTTYAYDDNGNRETITRDGTTITPTYDDQDRLITYGDNAYTYTDNGELLTKTNTDGTTTYTYDVLGNLKSANLADGTSIEYIIDAQNRRVGKKVDGTQTQGFIYKDQLKPIAELDGSNNVRSIFIYASKTNVPDYMVKSGTTYRIMSDQLGSPVLVVNASTGAIEQKITYDEFGNITSDTNPAFQPFGFAGGLYDQNTKLTRFGARDYDAETGRWTAKDLIGFGGGDSDLYVYCNNNPVNIVDPSGLWVGVDDLIFTVGGAVVGLATQGISDLIDGKLSGWEDYAGAAIGGAAGGESLLYLGPFASGAIGGAATNLAKQGFKNLSGKCFGFNFESFAFDTGFGAASGFIFGLKIPGITLGQGSYNAIYKQMSTKLMDGTISNVSAQTAGKMFIGRIVDKGIVTGIPITPVLYNSAKEGYNEFKK